MPSDKVEIKFMSSFLKENDRKKDLIALYPSLSTKAVSQFLWNLSPMFEERRVQSLSAEKKS